MQSRAANTHKRARDCGIQYVKKHNDGGYNERSGAHDISRSIDDRKKGVPTQIDNDNARES